MQKRTLSIVGLLLVALAVLALAWPENATAQVSKLQDLINKTPVGTGPGQIDPNAPPGFMGIPGAPSPWWFWGILWGIWVGWIFSTVGAFGGIMAGVGHLTVFGLADYGRTFKTTNPALNKLLTDSIRTSNQYLVGLSAFISSITYYRLGRLVMPLGLALALGGIAGAYLIPFLTAGKISLSAYVGYFGLIVLVIGCFLFYETTPQGQAKKKKAKEAAKAFEESVKKKAKSEEAGGSELTGVRVQKWGLTKINFTFYGVEFSFNPIWPFLGGFVIAAISAFIGVGGGFLYVPFLTSVTNLPMYIVAGTSALAVLVSMVTSIFTYMFIKGTPIDFVFIGAELIGIAIGSFVGPVTSKYIPDVWLKRLFVLLAIYVGIRYTTKGFLGYSIVP
ncbi:MAG: sulfite exporter TauE/SafE family protein [Desulfobacca sp.]|uniref:sulfite exporter TauE/SafE family protein n=1 Tax=Desulfobacca sp. TaxID=2067990 RepID=UPI00404B9300